jgi:hypothetical protein
MNIASVSPKDLLLRSLRDHDMAAKRNMQIATQHLKRGYEIARELERFEHAASQNLDHHRRDVERIT